MGAEVEAELLAVLCVALRQLEAIDEAVRRHRPATPDGAEAAGLGLRVQPSDASRLWQPVGSRWRGDGAMADWQVARLIPTSGINNDVEAEVRATSALLAVLSVVRDFSDSLLTPLGASSARKATVESFIETAFKLGDGSTIRPDGLVRVSYGKGTFTALVEVKTGTNPLRAEQVNAYWEVAREYGFDAVITISNEIALPGSTRRKGSRFGATRRSRSGTTVGQRSSLPRSCARSTVASTTPNRRGSSVSSSATSNILLPVP